MYVPNRLSLSLNLMIRPESIEIFVTIRAPAKAKIPLSPLTAPLA